MLISLTDGKWSIWLYKYEFPITKDPYLHQSPNQVGLHIWHDLKSPYMTEYDSYYIIGIYMTFTSNDIHDIYKNHQRQEHASYHQILYSIYDMHHRHMSTASRTTTIYDHHQFTRKDNVALISSTYDWICHISIHPLWPYQDKLSPLSEKALCL